MNEHNFHEYPIPDVKLTRIPYQQFKTADGRYILSDEHPLCIWHQQLMNKPWDGTVASLSYARSRYREWFIVKKDRASKRLKRNIKIRAAKNTVEVERDARALLALSSCLLQNSDGHSTTNSEECQP